MGERDYPINVKYHHHELITTKSILKVSPFPKTNKYLEYFEAND